MQVQGSMVLLVRTGLTAVTEHKADPVVAMAAHARSAAVTQAVTGALVAKEGAA
jgi:hypothetical protein